MPKIAHKIVAPLSRERDANHPHHFKAGTGDLKHWEIAWARNIITAAAMTTMQLDILFPPPKMMIIQMFWDKSTRAEVSQESLCTLTPAEAGTVSEITLDALQSIFLLKTMANVPQDGLWFQPPFLIVPPLAI